MSVVQPQETAVFLLQRGARGSIDGRAREGKLITCVEKDLLASLGGPPTPAQTIAIRRRPFGSTDQPIKLKMRSRPRFPVEFRPSEAHDCRGRC